MHAKENELLAVNKDCFFCIRTEPSDYLPVLRDKWSAVAGAIGPRFFDLTRLSLAADRSQDDKIVARKDFSGNNPCKRGFRW